MKTNEIHDLEKDLKNDNFEITPEMDEQFNKRVLEILWY